MEYCVGQAGEAGKKEYYAILDSGIAKEVPQSLQHLAIGHMATQLNGRIVFYTTEQEETRDSHAVILQKIVQQPKIAGFVYFRLGQFGYGGSPQLKVLEEILSRGYEVHFAKEGLSVLDMKGFDALFPLLYARYHVEARERGSYLSQVWKELGFGAPQAGTER